MKKPAAFAMIVALFFSAGWILGMQTSSVTITIINETKPIQRVFYEPYQPENAMISTIKLPAVDEEGNGLTTLLHVQLSPGSGRVLANIDRLLFWTDTQNSIRTARKVAADITGVNLSNYDIIYTVETNATSVEGPSAGSALTIATIAAIKGAKINDSVMITGTVNHDGTIGPVGNIMPKAVAAKSAGASLLLVPLMHSSQITYTTKKYCEDIGISKICTTEQVPDTISISDEAGINIIEVNTIEEALGYFLVDAQI
jgi:uncharacterized protein